MSEPAPAPAPAAAAVPSKPPPTTTSSKQQHQQHQPSPAIPVGLNEAGLDSPTFRATAAHFSDQVEAIERWLDDYTKASSKVAREILALEDNINLCLAKSFPPAAAVDGVIDNDYTLLALRRSSDGIRAWWSQVISTMRRMDGINVDPIRAFLTGELRSFKETRRALDSAQRQFDQMLARYVAQPKTKEPSSLREDAFAVYEARKIYLAASMDFCQMAPHLRFSLDKLLVRVSADMWKELTRAHESVMDVMRWGTEMDRIRGWSREMDATESVFRRELMRLRRDISHAAKEATKPSRELDDYSASTVPYLGSRGPVSVQTQDRAAVISEKQGWLFLRSVYGKPARTTWVRRWYYCRDGIFGWLIQGPQGVLQGDEIGVLLCSAKPAVAEDRRFCFEIKTKSQTMVLQAETQAELTEWLEVFDVAKRKAFDASMGRDSTPLPSGLDPAFHITPPPVPEFSAKSLDAQLAGDELPAAALDRAGTLPVPGPDGTLTSRASFDINAAGGSRRSITALGRDLGREMMIREEGESSREHAARLIQKLDLHRKGTFGSELDARGHGAGAQGGGGGGGGGGIASLISASHGLLPGHPASIMAPVSGKPAQSPAFAPRELLQGRLAPATLAKAPVLTALSRTAVVVTGDKGLALDAASHLPAAVMANYWGSNPWGTVYGTGHGSPRTPGQMDENPFGLVVTEVGKAGEEKPAPPVGAHRKTVSVDTTRDVQKTAQPRQQVETFPPGYPQDLRAQHPQFRLLFPAVPLDEKLVLVFSAAWTSSTGKEDTAPQGEGIAGNGRIFVTSDNLYFYGEQLGLVIAYTMSLDMITEVTAAPGKECDYIYLHLGDESNDTGYSRITIKIFLENLVLLHARLNLLVDDLQAEEPMALQELVTALIGLEHDTTQRRPSVDSWEEIPSSTPCRVEQRALAQGRDPVTGL
ncbi:hypothetical protein VdG2_06026 [Verticillium dahliae VDG2]|nr:hypothetical protein VdG2_06026 [Verticillium dahliae VDG2]